MRDYPQTVIPNYRYAIFLDRDGTINYDKNYTYKIEELDIIPESLEALKVLSKLKLHIIVITNQAGIALGIYNKEQMSLFNTELRKIVEIMGGRIDAFYFCPHLEAKNLKYDEKVCFCSKPNPGMIFEAEKDYKLNLTKSYMIGDKIIDIIAGTNAGCRYNFLIDSEETNYNKEYIVKNSIYEAALFIKEDFHNISI